MSSIPGVIKDGGLRRIQVGKMFFYYHCERLNYGVSYGIGREVAEGSVCQDFGLLAIWQ